MTQYGKKLRLLRILSVHQSLEIPSNEKEVDTVLLMAASKLIKEVMAVGVDDVLPKQRVQTGQAADAVKLVAEKGIYAFAGLDRIAKLLEQHKAYVTRLVYLKLGPDHQHSSGTEIEELQSDFTSRLRRLDHAAKAIDSCVTR